MNTLNEIEKDLFREKLSKYTRKAFETLPFIEHPSILDIGCGSGIPTLELAKLSNGEIIGLDVDQELLDNLNSKIAASGLSDRVRTVNCSIFDIDFPDESFDIIWSEGSIFVIGFERGLKEWRRLIKEKGFLIVHDETTNRNKKIKTISDCGYTLIDCFILSKEVWWAEYYCHLENRIRDLKEKYNYDSTAQGVLKKEQDEIDAFKKEPEYYGSIFYIMQRKSI
jgi:ubiquinone/menaquinone biosynthesis C-methylase UbiE